ncbi:MAG: hypothetical protein ABJD07_16360, partial [Gemmatimonadaceae bacterium]
ADSAVALQESANALELRGNLSYWKYLLQLGETPGAQDQLLAAAERDLERARTINPAQSGALASLSHLYARTNRLTEGKLAAQRAYESDAYLANADGILNRLFTTSWDLHQLAEARQWCAEGHRRFPSDYRFLDCQIRLMAEDGLSPEIDSAWSLAARVAALASPAESSFRSHAARMWTAAVIAQAASRLQGTRGAQLADSARRVAKGARLDAGADRRADLVQWEAIVDVILGDHDSAVERLQAWAATNPGSSLVASTQPGAPVDVIWMFQPLRDDPRIKRLWSASSR